MTPAQWEEYDAELSAYVAIGDAGHHARMITHGDSPDLLTVLSDAQRMTAAGYPQAAIMVLTYAKYLVYSDQLGLTLKALEV